MNSNIKFWYDYTFKIAEFIELSRINNEKIDEQSIWKNIEQDMIGINIENLYYKSQLLSILKKTNFDKNYSSFVKKIEKLLNKNYNLKITMIGILKIAYFAGKISILIKMNKLSEEIKKFIETNNILDLDTYISKEDQEKINKLYLDGTKLDKIRENIHNL